VVKVFNADAGDTLLTAQDPVIDR